MTKLIKKLMLYTPDQMHYYIITLLKREDKPEILTYTEAEKDDTLSQLIDKLLQIYKAKGKGGAKLKTPLCLYPGCFL